MLRMLLLLLVITLPAFAQGGLAMSISPAVIHAGEPCDWVWIELSNLNPNNSYSVLFSLARNQDSGPALPMTGYSVTAIIPNTAITAQGTAKVLFCVEVAAGTYTITGTANSSATPSQPPITGTAVLTVH